jgi:hypothetical protein
VPAEGRAYLAEIAIPVVKESEPSPGAVVHDTVEDSVEEAVVLVEPEVNALDGVERGGRDAAFVEVAASVAKFCGEQRRNGVIVDVVPQDREKPLCCVTNWGGRHGVG